MHPCTTSHSHTHLHPFFANQSRSGGGNKNFAHQVIVTGPPLKSKIGLVYGVTHGEVWWGVRAVETLSIFGPLSFGTGAQHSIEEYPDCGQFQLFEPLSNIYMVKKETRWPKRHERFAKCLNKSPTRSTVCKTMIVWLRQCHPQEAIHLPVTSNSYLPMLFW